MYKLMQGMGVNASSPAFLKGAEDEEYNSI